MRKPINFTPWAIDDLRLDAGETDVWVWELDRSCGLGVRLRRGKRGVSRMWYVAYTFGGADRRDPLGNISNNLTLADARHRAYEIRKDARNGVDPRGDAMTVIPAAAPSCPSFVAYVEHYLARKLKELRPNTYRDRERYLTGPYVAPFQKLRLDQITKQAVAARINFLQDTGITKPSATVAQAARMALLDVFKFAIAEGHITENPVLGTRQPAPPREQQGRDRVLAGAELAALWNASGNDDYGRITKQAILLGGRRQEIGGMRWSEISANGVWTLPAERSKTGEPLSLPLPPAALAIIRSIARHDDRDQIFGGRSADGFTLWSAGKRALDAAVPLKPWVFHDLRRTLITGLHELGVDERIVRAIVNHSAGSDVHNKHYNHATYDAQKADALQNWAGHVLSLVGGNVVALAA